jgi:hypothetical protein
MESPAEDPENPDAKRFSPEELQDLAEFWAKVDQEREEQDAKVNAAIQEAKRRGIPLHEIIPVN